MKSQKVKKPNYEELGKMIEAVYETAYINRRRMYKMSFFKGVAGGVGGVVGATVVIAVLAWTLSLLDFGPFKPVVNNIQNTIEQSKK